jgi:hypothetical protein
MLAAPQLSMIRCNQLQFSSAVWLSYKYGGQGEALTIEAVDRVKQG